jgi:hypothetical protein
MGYAMEPQMRWWCWLSWGAAGCCRGKEQASPSFVTLVSPPSCPGQRTPHGSWCRAAGGSRSPPPGARAAPWEARGRRGNARGRRRIRSSESSPRDARGRHRGYTRVNACRHTRFARAHTGSACEKAGEGEGPPSTSRARGATLLGGAWGGGGN